MCFCFTYNDPALGARKIQAILINKKWFFTSQGDSLTLIAGAFNVGTPSIYGTDGTHVYKLYSDTASNIKSMIQTALWPMSKPTGIKSVLKAGIEVSSRNVVTLNVTVDSESNTQPVTFTGQNNLTWINNAGAVVTWQNNALQTVVWIGSGLQFMASNVEQYGRYYGFTSKSTTPAFTYIGIMSQFEDTADWGDPVGV